MHPSVDIVCKKVSELFQLLDDWDSYGAVKPTGEACIGAVNVACQLFRHNTPIPSVFPVPNGNIQLEWSCHGLDIEIQVTSLYSCNVLYQNLTYSDKDWEGTCAFDDPRLLHAILLLTAKEQFAPTK